MNPNSSPFGSIWRKWDLHFHTPASYDYAHKAATNQEIVNGLVKAGVEVVAITDHHRIDTARVIELQKLGGANLTVLPGIEFRSELGGSISVHYIGIFPESSDIVDLWTKLSGKLNITEEEVVKRGDDTKSIDEVSAPIQARAHLADAAARETELSGKVSGLKQKLDDFLKGRGLSPENLADVGKEIPRDCRILPARRPRHGGALQNLEGKAGGDKIKFLAN